MLLLTFYSVMLTIMTKAAKRLWFLKKLKRAGVSVDDLVHYYQISVVRPVLEYTCPVWHSSLSKRQIKSLEKFNIVLCNTSYTEASSTLGIQLLADRRSELCRTLFTQIVNNESHSLHYLLPVKRDTQLIGRLRSATVYPTFHVQTTNLKIRSYPFAYLNISDTSDILFYCVCCACVWLLYVWLSLSSLWLPNNNKCMYVCM